jgi:hypothetical protein
VSLLTTETEADAFMDDVLEAIARVRIYGESATTMIYNGRIYNIRDAGKVALIKYIDSLPSSVGIKMEDVL